MLSIRDWMKLVDHKITDGSDYFWSCYGPNAYTLDSWNGVHGKGGYSASIIFSTKTQKVYEVTVCDYTNDRAYRMINPKNVEKHRTEAVTRQVSSAQAWDDVDYVDLEVDEDFIEKGLAIQSGEVYGTDILIPIDLPNDVLLQAALQAHKQNITLNAYINTALRELVEKVKRDEGFKETL